MAGYQHYTAAPVSQRVSFCYGCNDWMPYVAGWACERCGTAWDAWLDIMCWCEGEVVKMRAVDVQHGITGSCGQPGCER